MLIPLDDFEGMARDAAHFVNMERGEGTKTVTPEQARNLMANRPAYCGWWL